VTGRGTGAGVGGRHVAVTGAAGGIGAASVAALVAAGGRVSAGDLVADQVRAVADRAARGGPGDAVGLPLDVTDPASYRAFLAAAHDRFGPLDVLVGNAGVMWVGPFAAEPEAAVRRQLEVNVHGVIRGAQLAVPAMVERGRGQLITVASVASRIAPAGEATYSATKHAVLGYCTALRAELRGTGVDVSLIMPTVVETELAAGTTHGRVRRLRPDDVAAAVVRTVRRPRPEVYVPRSVAALVRLRDALPGRVREAMIRAMVPNQVAATDPATRTEYHRRALGLDE
jgi:NADP-dependent 3-hydroxy acid dehydrogenase YdfG